MVLGLSLHGSYHYGVRMHYAAKTMLRTRIALLVIILTSSVLVLGSAVFWGVQQTEYYFQRSRLAHASGEAYLHLAQDVYRHFKEQLDIVIKRLDPLNAESVKTFEKLNESLKAVEIATREEISHVRDEGEESEIAELEHAAKLQAVINEGVQAFDTIHRLHGEGRATDADQTLRQLLDVLIDKQLSPLIDTAVAKERAEVVLADQRAALVIHRLRVMAVIVGVASAIFALVVGILLFRRLKQPLDTLMHGTRQIAAGDLAHRIELDGHDELTHLAKHINDMTRDLEQQRNQLIQARSDLEKKVEARTVELLDANNKLRHVDEARRLFFADVSHELRTPLTIIRGEAEVTLRGRIKNAEESHAALVRIIDLTAQLSKLVDDLLFLARTGTEGVRFDFSAVEIRSLVEEAWEDAIALTQRRDMEVKLSLPDTTTWIHGDRLRLKQLLHILINNAVCYSKDGGIIQLSLESIDDWAVIRVADQGIGIAGAEQHAVFERFFRGTNARRVSSAGTGLGLPLAKSIVDAHRGTITLCSAENEGTTVTVKLPLSGNEESRDGDPTDRGR